MANVFFTADTHFGHARVLEFEPNLRPFASIEEHDEKLIENWNKVVRPHDLVWHLGDVYLGKDPTRFHEIMSRLNGTKKLVRGNHDTLQLSNYANHFDEVYGVWPKYGFVMSHVPLHPDSVTRWGLNVHGHLHSHRVQDTMEGHIVSRNDPRYYCVSVEQRDLTPVSLDMIRKHVAIGKELGEIR